MGNINGKGTAQNTYDAIVIGSGMTGGWAAKELCDHGIKHWSWKEEKISSILKIILLQRATSGSSTSKQVTIKNKRREPDRIEVQRI